MLLFLRFLSIAYRIIVIYILIIAIWNIITVSDLKCKVMTTTLIIPLILRALNIV